MMVDKNSPGPLLTFLTRHGEKLAFAGASTALASYLVLGLALRNTPDSTFTRSTTQHLARLHQDIGPAGSRLPVIGVLEPLTTATSIVPANAWAASFPTQGLVDVKVRSGDPAPILRTFSLTSVAATEESVTIRWESKPVPEDCTELPLVTLRLERRASGTWTEIASLPPSATEYRDATEPCTTYSYRLIPVAKDLQPTPTNELSAITPTDWKVAVVTADPATASAFLTIERYLRGKGWSKAQSLHNVGVSTTLKKVEAITTLVRDRRCQPVFNAVGAVIGCRPVAFERRVEQVRLTLADNRGTPVILCRPDALAECKLCPIHLAAQLRLDLIAIVRWINPAWSEDLRLQIEK